MMLSTTRRVTSTFKYSNYEEKDFCCLLVGWIHILAYQEYFLKVFHLLLFVFGEIAQIGMRKLENNNACFLMKNKTGRIALFIWHHVAVLDAGPCV